MLVMSLIAFVAYFIDKQRAIRKKWRIKEAVLLSLGFFGGSIGALAAMSIFRHKTKHYYFYFINVLGLLASGAILIYLLGGI